ncbi:CD44 antigen isoform X2 [Tamandua tetradactyla]|uniref:CD44 antigen isoform X2 n=1 Tax=Tamandua tetradactyla TaxID=48850 RepID=UPI0040548ECF
MATFWWRAAWGLCLMQLSLAQIDLNITCRYAGVFHVEKNGRYSISRTEAADLCKAFNSTLPTMAQMQHALRIGFETCRYGFIEGHVVIPRITPNAICAANNTGVYIVTSNTSQYDAYCFNASAPPDKEDCASVTDLPNAFEGPITITIVNRDGTRYSQQGEYRTNPEDIHPSDPTDEDVSSGSSSERSTSGGYILHTSLPTADPTPEHDSPWRPLSTRHTPATITPTVHSNSHAAAQKPYNWMWSWFGNSQRETQDLTTTTMTALPSTSGTTPERTTKRQEVQDWFSWWFQPSQPKNHLHTTTKMAAQPLMQVTTTGSDSNTISAGWEPNEENEDEKENSPSYSGSGIDDDEDFIASTISTTLRVFNYPKENEDRLQWNPPVVHPEVLLQTTSRMTDVDTTGTRTYGENWTQEPHLPLIHQEHHEKTQPSTSTTQATPSRTAEETTTQKEQWLEHGWPGEYPQTPKEDFHSTTGTAVTTASAHDSPPSQRMTTQSQVDRSWTDFFDPISHPMGQGHQTEGRMDTDSSHSTMLQATADPNIDFLEDLDRTRPFTMTTQQSHSQSFSTAHGDLEEDKDHPTAPTPTSSNRNDGRGGRRGGNLSEDSTTSEEGYIPHSPDTKENKTLIPLTTAMTGSPEVTEVNVFGGSNFNVDRSFSGDQDSSMDSSGRAHTTHGSESAGHSRGSQEGGANTTSGPIRKPQIPEWLIILASLLALALILAVCIAVNSRRRCGQKKKLVINSDNGAVGDRKPSGLNGEASKSQEMVHLVNKEPSETPDQFMTADETRNLQNVDMKIGV